MASGLTGGHLACLLGRCSEFDNRPGSSNCSGSPSPVSRPKLSLSSFDEQDSRCAGQSGMRCPVSAGGTSPPALWGRTPHPTGRAGTARIGQVRPFPVPRRLGRAGARHHKSSPSWYPATSFGDILKRLFQRPELAGQAEQSIIGQQVLLRSTFIPLHWSARTPPG